MAHGREMSSEESSEEEVDPETRKAMFYEEVLK